MAGLMLWPGDRGRDAITGLRDLMDGAPDELATAGVYLTGPPEPFVPEHLHGDAVLRLALMWAGEPRTASRARAAARARARGRPGRPDALRGLQLLIDDPPGLRTAGPPTTSTRSATRRSTRSSSTSERCRPGRRRRSLLVPWGGAVAGVARASTPMAGATRSGSSHPFAPVGGRRDDDEAHRRGRAT